MEIDFRAWNQDQLDRWCSQPNWRNQLSDLVLLETDSSQQKALLNVIIRGRGDHPLQGSGFWNRSPNALLVYKTIIQNLADRVWVANMDITVEVIDWLFSFVLDSSFSFIHRMTALTIISTLVKTKSLAHVALGRIVLQFPEIFTQLELSIPTYLAQETNPLLLLTSQLQDIIEVMLLKHESIIAPVLVKSLAIILSLVNLCFSHSSSSTAEEVLTKSSNNQQEKFRIQILTIFVMAAESRKSLEGSLTGIENKDQLLHLLQAFTQHIIHSTTIHNVYHSSFHHVLHFLLLQQTISPSSLLQILSTHVFKPILSILDHADEEGQRLDLQDLLDLQIIEVLIGFISNFFDERTYPLLIRSNPTESEPTVHSMITGTVDMMMALQLKLKAITKELNQKKVISVTVKDLKAAYSEVRKGCISCLESIFQQSPIWIQKNTNAFWKLSIQSLMTPILFPYAVAVGISEKDGEECNADLKEKIFSYLYQAIEKIHLYSYAAIEDIFECIHQLTDKQCIDFFTYSPREPSSSVIEELRRCLTRYPTKQEKTRSREYKWWILILSTIQNVIMMMQKKEAFYGHFMLSEWLWQYFHDCSSRLLELPALLKNEDRNQSKSRVKMTYKLSTLTKATNNTKQRNEVTEEEEEDASIEYQHVLLSSLALLSDTLTLIQSRSSLTVSSPSSNSQIISLVLWEDIFLYLKKKMKKLQYYEYEDEMTEKYLLVDVYVKMLLLYADIQQFSLTHDWLIKQVLFLSYYGQINPATTTTAGSKLLSKKKTLFKQHHDELVLTVEQEALKSKEKLEALRDRLREHLLCTEGEVGRDGVESIREEMTFIITWLELIINHFNKPSTPTSSDPSKDIAVSDAIMKVTRDELALHMIQQLLSV